MNPGGPHCRTTRPVRPDPRVGEDLGGYCIASPTALSYGDKAGWTHIGWHEIERGGWNAELRKPSWVLHAAPGKPSPRGSLELLEPGRLPELSRAHFGNDCC